MKLFFLIFYFRFNKLKLVISDSESDFKVFDTDTTDNTEDVTEWNTQNTQYNTDEPLIPVEWDSVSESTTELDNDCLHNTSEEEDDNKHP